MSGGTLSITGSSSTSLGTVSGGVVFLTKNATADADVVSGGSMTIQGTLNVTTLASGFVSNAGLLNVSGGTFSGSLLGSGTLSTNGKLIMEGSSSAFDGRLVVLSGGDLTVNSALGGQNNLSVAASGTATFGVASVSMGKVENSGTLGFLANAGTVLIARLEGASSGVTTFSSCASIGSLSSMGLTRVTGGTLSVQSTSANLGGLSVDAGARANILSAARFTSVIAGGSVSVQDRSQIDYLAGSGTVADSGTISIGSGYFSGKLQIGGALVKSTDGTFVISGSTAQPFQSTIVQSGSLLLEGTNVLDPSGKIEVLAGGLFAVMNGDGQIFDSIVVHGGATIGLPGYDGYIKATNLNLGAATYYLTPVAVRSGSNNLTEAQTKGSTQMLNGIGQLSVSSNSFNSFTFDLGEQSSGAAVLSGTIYSDALVLTGASAGTLRFDEATNFSNVHTLVVGASNSTGVQLDVRKYNGGTLVLGGSSQRAGISQIVQGSGSILGNIRIGSSAILAPGNSPGTLTVVGSTTVDVGGALQFEYTANNSTEAGSGPNDALNLSGAFTSSGTIVAVAYDSSGNARVTDLKRHTINIITYGSGANPTLNGSIPSYITVAGTPVRSLTVGASLNSGTYGLVQLIIQRESIGSSAGGDGNIASVGSLLDSALTQTSGPLADLSALIDIQSSKKAVSSILSAINPAIYAELPNLSFARTTELNTVLEGRLNGLAIGSMDESGPAGIYLWNTTYGSNQTRAGEADLGTFGYASSAFGNVSGVEAKLGSMTLGVSGAVGSSSASFGSGRGSVTSENWLASSYLSVPFGQLVFSGAVGYGNADSSVKRAKNILVGAETNVAMEDTEWLAQVGVAWPLRTGLFQVTPSVNLFYSGYREDAIHETGGGSTGLNNEIQPHTFHSEALKTGVQIARVTQLSTTPVRMSCTVDWLHSFDSDKRSTVEIGSAYLPGVTQKYQSAKAGAESLRIGLGCEWSPTSRTTVRANAASQAQSGQRTTSGNLTIGIAF